MSRAGYTSVGLAAIAALAIACGQQSQSPVSPGGSAAGGDAAADGSTLKVTAPTPISPINDATVQGNPTLAATTSTPRFGGSVALTYHFQVFSETNATVADSSQNASPSLVLTALLDFKKRYTWRVRAESGVDVGPWSATASFISPEGGYIRGNEVFDPLFNGATVGEIIGPTTFVAGKGLRLDSNLSYVRYAIPTLTSGEFSMEIEGLRSNLSGDKSKVFSMSTNSADFITDPFRVDVQYRGTTGSPPNAITYRVLYGDADDLGLRYEPDTATRINSVVPTVATQTYYWKYTWGNGEVRVQVREGGVRDNGRLLYNVGVTTRRGQYNPNPHYVYLGSPTGRSGAESASIPGTTYRNVWISRNPRP
jgi:hypothetical protein